MTRLARERGWLSEELAGPAVLALALLAYTGSLAVDGNGFVAAFVGGLVFGNVAGPSGEKEVYFVDQSADVASMISWLVFGALAVPVMQDTWSWTLLAYAVLSLTVVRMLPVALALLGAGLDRFSVGFVGWFGPRGLASVIFALIALEDLRRRRARRRGGHLAHDPAQRAWPTASARCPAANRFPCRTSTAPGAVSPG